MELGWLFHWRVGALSRSRYPCQRGISAWRGGSQPNDPSRKDTPSRWLTSYECSIVMLKPIYATPSSQLLGKRTTVECIGFLRTWSWCHRFVAHTSGSVSGTYKKTTEQVTASRVQKRGFPAFIFNKTLEVIVTPPKLATTADVEM